jgi:hypothetical protein
MADLFQGAALPDQTTTTQVQNTAPQFYTDYLQNVAALGQNAVQQGGVAGMGGLTQQAMNLAPTTGFAGATSAGTAQDLGTQAGYTGSNQIVQNYMNPYQTNVVDEMARLTNRNVQENIMPQLDAMGVASGNFGSQRGGQIGGQVLRDIQADLLGKQYGALNTGYQNALTTAGNDLTRGVNAASTLNQTGQVQNAIGTGGLGLLNTLGKQQQGQTQAELDYPMLQAQNYAKLFGTPTIPTGSVTAKTAPGTQNSYGIGPLQQIVSLATMINALGSGNFKDANTAIAPAKADGGSITSGMDIGHPSGATHVDANGNYYDESGNLVG